MCVWGAPEQEMCESPGAHLSRALTGYLLEGGTFQNLPLDRAEG